MIVKAEAKIINHKVRMVTTYYTDDKVLSGIKINVGRKIMKIDKNGFYSNIDKVERFTAEIDYMKKSVDKRL